MQNAKRNILGFCLTTAVAVSPLVAQPIATVTMPPAAPATAPSFSDDAPELFLYSEMPVIVAAGKREQSQRQAAASVTVVDAKQIELFGYRSLADVLRGQRSFFMQTDGLNWMAGVRGFLRPGEWNARLMVLVDGRPTRENVYGQVHLDQDFAVPMEAVKRVEIIRGPGSALYGSNAVFAVINVVTKDGADIDGVQARVQGGSYGTARAQALFGKKFDNGWDVMGSISGMSSDGRSDVGYDGINDAAHDFGHIRGFDSQKVDSLFLKGRKGDFTAEVSLADRQVDNRSATYFASWANPGGMREERSDVTLKLDHDIAPGRSFHAMVYYGRYAYKQSYGLDGAPAREIYQSAAYNEWVGAEAHYDWQVNSRLHVLAGADGTQALYTHQRDTDSIDGEVLNVDPSFNNWGIFSEVEYKISDKLTLVGGLRLDDVQRVGVSLSPRAAAIINVTPEDTLKALYGRSFRAPNVYEMFYASPNANTPNPNLKSEFCDTYELVWERQFHSGWRTSLGGYLWRLSDAMQDFQDATGAVQTRNDGNLQAYGIEGELQKEWENRATFRIYATAGRADHDQKGLDFSPNWTVGSALAFPLFGRTFLSIEPKAVAGMKADGGDYTQPTFITNTVVTSKDIIKNMDLQIGLYNLFSDNARFPADPGNYHQATLNYPQTTLLVTLTYKF